MDSSQWPTLQGTGSLKSMEEITASCASNEPEQVQERQLPKLREQPKNCLHCNSSNTKFCYYNNYSLTQPRYFCKACRRYWTKVGSLRNVPVEGGSRKNKESPSPPSSSAASSSSLASQNLKTSYEAEDLTLSFPKFESNIIPSSSLSAQGIFNKALIPNLKLDSSSIEEDSNNNHGKGQGSSTGYRNEMSKKQKWSP